MSESLAPVLPLRIAASVTRLESSLAGWSLLEPGVDRARSYATTVHFEQPFAQPPVVHAALAGFDIENGDAARLALKVTAVRADGFDLALETWFETKIWSVAVSWLAVGH
jgi:hypothetical protein